MIKLWLVSCWRHRLLTNGSGRWTNDHRGLNFAVNPLSNDSYNPPTPTRVPFTGVTNARGPSPQPTACRSPTCSPLTATGKVSTGEMYPHALELAMVHDLKLFKLQKWVVQQILRPRCGLIEKGSIPSGECGGPHLTLATGKGRYTKSLRKLLINSACLMSYNNKLKTLVCLLILWGFSPLKMIQVSNLMQKSI